MQKEAEFQMTMYRNVSRKRGNYENEDPNLPLKVTLNHMEFITQGQGYPHSLTWQFSEKGRHFEQRDSEGTCDMQNSKTAPRSPPMVSTPSRCDVTVVQQWCSIATGNTFPGTLQVLNPQAP